MPPLVDAARGSMRHARLPTELCERLVDFVSGMDESEDPLQSWHSHEVRGALSQCMQTCRAWVPRARMHLYTNPRLVHVKQVDGFVLYAQHDFSRGKVFNGWVWIYKSEIIPITPLKLAPCQKAISSLRIFGPATVGSRTHRTFLQALSSFRQLSRLWLTRITFETFSFLARLVLSFPNLRHLKLDRAHQLELGGSIPSPRLLRYQRLSLHSLSLEDLSNDLADSFLRWLGLTAPAPVLHATAVHSPLRDLRMLSISDCPLASPGSC